MLPVEIKSILEKRAKDGWVPEHEAKAILKIAGVPLPSSAFAATRQQAMEKAAQIGFPVAAKVVSVKIVHKSDVGGVAINIKDKKALEDVWERFEKLEAFEGMVIDAMTPGLELFLGARDDEQFGPVVILGLGGTAVEIYQDIAIRMAPLEKDDVLSMIRELKGAQLITGYRGKPSVNLDALAKAVTAFSRLAMDMAGAFSSMDINPLMATPDGCAAVDARIIL
ncbi:MAG: acetate--CoA ligase family protein [Desulfatibacillaceae bacterium]|nr:acetate--CoA ligase family protein [Desulfatibacillaceae bacterium]